MHNMNMLDFKQLFEQSPALEVVIDLDFMIVAASDAFLQVTKTKRENIIGRDIFHAFPNNPGDISANGETVVRDSFIRVLTTKMADSLPIVKYDIPKPESEGGGFEVKYWQATNSPILDENNNVKYIIQRAEDLTENKTLITQLEFEKKALKLVEDSEKRYNMMLMKSQFAFAVLKGKNKVITLANDRVKKIWGKGMDIEGKSLLDIMPELKDTPFPAILDDVYDTGIPFHGVDIQSPKDPLGELKEEYFNFVFQPYLEADETISGITIIGYEVSDSVIVKKALEAQHEAEQKALKQIANSEKQLQTLLSTAPAAIAVLEGPSLKYVLANADYQKMTNRSEAQLLGKTMLEAFPELTGTGAFEIFEDIYKTGETFSVAEYPTAMDKNNDGVLQRVYYKFTAAPIKDADGKFNSIMVLSFDVTAQIDARKKIEESDKRYNMMLMQSPFGFAILKGKDMVITLANDSIKTFWGKGKDVEGKPLFDVISELKHSEFPGLIDNVYTTGIPFHGEDLLAPIFRDGKQEEVYFNFVYQPYLEADETISGVTIIAYEVTAQVTVKKALEAQREAEQKALKLVEETNKRYYTMLMESPFAFSIMKGKEMVVSLANDLMKEFWGKGNDVEGKTLLQLLPEMQDQPFPAMIDHVFTTGKPVYANEILAQLRQKARLEDKYFNIIYQPYYEADNTILGVTTIAYDVTEMVLARKKIEESEIHFRQLADLMPAKISNADPAGNVTYFNKHWLDYTRYSFEELRDFGYHKIMHPDELDEFQKRLQIAGETGTVLEMEIRFMNKEGDYRWHLNLASPIKDENGHIKMWVGSTTDIHEQKTVSEKIKASEERFRLLVTQAPVCICVLRGEAFMIETINQEMADFLDRKIEDSLHKPLFDVITEVKGQVYKELLETVYRTGKRFVAQELPLTIKRNNVLEDIFVKFVYEPLREADGTISGVMVLAHEITDQVKARKTIEISEKKFRILTNAMPQKITNADADGNVIFFNQQWLDDTGLTFEELKDWGWEKSIILTI